MLVSSLERIAAESQAADLAAPALVVIGDIVSARQQILDARAEFDEARRRLRSAQRRRLRMRRHAPVARRPQRVRMRKLKLIGIGAGNPDYITLQAINALQKVDVVFVTDKGQETADLLRARREVCERHMQARPTGPWSFRIPSGTAVPLTICPAVAAWHEARAALYEQGIREQLADGECGAFLVWGDPSLYDSTLRIIDQVAARRAVEFDFEIIPGITSIQALAARHRISLNRIGEPVHITTGRRLHRRWTPGRADVVVLLDGQCAFKTVCR